MRTLRPEFLEAFVKQCYDRGMSEQITLDLFRYTHLQDVLDNDPDFREGWDEELQKRAGFADFASTVPFLQPPPRDVSTPVGAGAGAVAGGAAAGVLGAGMGLKGLPPLLTSTAKAHPFLRPTVKGVNKMLGGRLKSLAKAPLPWWGKGLALAGGATLGALGGGAAGHSVGVPRLSDGAGPAATFLPDALGPATPGASTSTASSLLSIPGTGLAGSEGAASTHAAGPNQGSQMIAQSNAQVKKLNADIQTAQAQATKALATPGIQGSAQAVEIRRRIADLEQQKQTILNSSNSYLGQMRMQQGQSMRSIDKALAQTLDARSARQPRADAMDRWLRSGDNNSWWYKLLNKVTGADNQAAQMASQMRNLDGSIVDLNNNRGRVRNMLLPGT